MDKKISQLTAATTPLTGAEELAIVQSGVTKKTTIEDVKGYKVYTALLTQSGGDGPTNVPFNYFGSLTVGVTYEIINTCSGMDFTMVGAPDNNIGTKFICNSTTIPNWGNNIDEVDLLLYNTGAPVVTVLENTIGNIWWTYGGVGIYLANSNNLFPVNKVYVDCKSIFNVQWLTNLFEDYEESDLPNGVVTIQNRLVATGVATDTVELGRVEIRVYN